VCASMSQAYRVRVDSLHVHVYRRPPCMYIIDPCMYIIDPTIVDAAEGNDWKVVPLCVEVGARGYINDK